MQPTQPAQQRGGPENALWSMLGAFGIAMGGLLVVAVLGMTGNIVSVAAPVPVARPAVAAPAAPAAAPAPAVPAALAPAKTTTVPMIMRGAATVPAPITRTAPATVKIDLETREVVAEVADGQTYSYWTFNGTVPGPMLRVRVGDTVELRLKNAQGSAWPHSIDLHAVTGPGGGATASQTNAGAETTFTFKALNPGLYVYHCATAPIPMHVANGMYGLILVEPEGGLPPVDREYMVVQGELYTNAKLGVAGHHEFNPAKMDDEIPDYVLFNGRVNGLTGKDAMTANVGERVRIYFGVGGFMASSLHLIGEIFDRVYTEGAVGTPPDANVQTTFVPAGGSAIVDFKVDVPGTYTLVDHTLTRSLNKGAVAQLVVAGANDRTIYSGPASGGGH